MSPFTAVDDKTEHLAAGVAKTNTICFNMFIQGTIFQWEQGEMHCDNRRKTSLGWELPPKRRQGQGWLKLEYAFIVQFLAERII